MSQEECQVMSEAPEESAWRVPGRVEVLGKHTDYAGGSVLVGAVDRAITARAHRARGPQSSLTATTTGGTTFRRSWTGCPSPSGPVPRPTYPSPPTCRRPLG